MRHLPTILLGMASLTIGSFDVAHSATYTVNLANYAFTEAGVSGTEGNGVVFASPKFEFGPGDTVDFGAAIVFPDPPDRRGGESLLGLAGLGVWFLKAGKGGYEPGSWELSGADLTSLNFVDCSPSASCQITSLAQTQAYR